MSAQAVSNPNGATGKLCQWAAALQLSDVPEDVQTRAMQIVLDCIGCGIVGAHLPWSEIAAQPIFDMEPPGDCSVMGWNKKLGASAATLINSTFIQGFELDDYHSTAPLHSASLLLPALFAAAEHIRSSHSEAPPISGETFLLAATVGLEMGPRIGLGLVGAKILAYGWHSGAVFGGPAVALAVSKLLGLFSPTDGVGIKHRVYASRWAAVRAVRKYGEEASGRGFCLLLRLARLEIECSMGSLHAMAFWPPFSPALAIQVSTKCWNARLAGYVHAGLEIEPALRSGCCTNCIGRELNAAMGGLHASIDCIRLLQSQHTEVLSDARKIKGVTIELGQEAYSHGGWDVKKRPLEVIGAQMSAKHVVAAQLIDGSLLPASFGTSRINSPDIYRLIDKTTCVHRKEFDGRFKTRVSISFDTEGMDVEVQVDAPKGVEPAMSNEEVREKYEGLTEGLVAGDRAEKIQRLALGMKDLKDVEELVAELRQKMECALK
ncbi:hypothetical protein MMC13_003305 [Lambiella insularis]|nr:hypothetical protein [Lambiella insularis]